MLEALNLEHVDVVPVQISMNVKYYSSPKFCGPAWAFVPLWGGCSLEAL